MLFDSHSAIGVPFLIDEVDAKAMQYQTPKNEISKRPLRADTSLALLHNLSRNAIHRLRCSLLRGWRTCSRSFAGLHA
jgi:hypothetical protein